ncbi:MAG: hypothetical protein IKH19_03670 [Muribaculaceae bacterium]|nr:hypothetical protein [Muribaculaceae bacterium]
MRRTVLLPLGLLVYLAVMAYLGLPHLRAGEYLFYFGVIGASLLVIVVLYFVLRRRERIRRENEESNYGTYKDERSKED